MQTIAEVFRSRLEDVYSRIEAACRRAGRSGDQVRLVAVTKTVPADIVRLLESSRVTDIGESRVQDAIAKVGELEKYWPGFSDPCSRKIRLHMIGHLQTNKAKSAFALFDLIHSVDSLRLARALAGEAEKAGRTARVFLQVNVSGEAAKSGLRPDELDETAREVGRLPGLAVEGLMTMAPEDPDPEKARPLFRRLRELRDAGAACGSLPANAMGLSMGMTQDFEVAVEEGATLVRVGSALFAGL